MIKTDDRSTNRTALLVAEAKREAKLLTTAEEECKDTTEHGVESLPTIPGYRILEEIRRGAQGNVYRATPCNDEVPLAIKLLSSDHTPSEVRRQRFEREVELLQRLSHPGIVSVLDHGIVDGRHFFVMPMIDGLPFDKACDLHALSLAEKVEWMVCVIEAVEAAHRIGVIHRDLKPSNVLMSPQGEAHLIDFGLATQLFNDEHSTQSDDAALTLTGQFIGSLPWSSPEHASCDPSRIDVRSDVYSLGVMLYQAATGITPHSCEGGPLAMLDRIKNEAPERPRMLDERIPVDLETIIQKCLQKSADRRYQSAGELKEELRRWLAGETIEARRDSVLYVLTQTIKQYKLASSLIVGAWIVGLFFGGTMVGLYQQAASQIAAVESENDQLKQKLAELQQRVVQPKSWMSAIKTSTSLREMPPEEGWEFMKTTWPKLRAVEAKQQFLKSIAFSNHAYTHRGLHFGIKDSAPLVQAWAANYLSDIALFEVAEENKRYLKWYEENSNRTLGKVLAVSTARVADDIRKACEQRDDQKLLMYLNCVAESRDLRDSKAVKVVVEQSDIADYLLETMKRKDKDLAESAGRALLNMPLDENFVQKHIAPLANNGNSYEVRTAIRFLGRIPKDWSTDLLLDCLLKVDATKSSSALWTIASALAEHNNPRTIPTMISVIEADNTYNTVYGVGYFGLGKLTGVKYDESHDGVWWRQWWVENQNRFQLTESDATIPLVRVAKKPVQRITNVVKQAANDKMANYILYHGGNEQAQPPEKGYKLLFILPGGDGSADFQGFCKNIASNTTNKTFLVAQLIAPVWDRSEAEKLVWPTRHSKYKEGRFTTEEQAALVLKDIRERHPVDEANIYTLSFPSFAWRNLPDRGELMATRLL